MKTKLKLAVLTLAIAGLVTVTLAAYQSQSVSAGGGEQVGGTTPVYDFQDHGNVEVMSPKQRGTSTLVRNTEGISMSLETTDLPVGTYSIWWVVFNKPSECTNGVCGASDDGRGGAPNPAEASVLWATGGVVGPDRIGHFSARLGVGLDKAPGQVLRGPSLTNPLGAEVHLILRFHGPAVWTDPAVFTSQLAIFAGHCDEFPCFMPQSAAHKP